MSEAAERPWRLYVEDMIGCAEKVLAYSDGLDQSGFVASWLNYDATVRNLELIAKPRHISPMPCVPPIRKFPGDWSSPPAIG